MAAATKDQMQTEFQFFGEIWNFYKHFYFVQTDEEYWENAIEKSGEICKKYNMHPLCKALVMSVMAELERKYKEIS